MNRAQWLAVTAGCRSLWDVLSRWEAGCLSMLEAGELLRFWSASSGATGSHEDDGFEGLRDGRLGKSSGKRGSGGEKDRVLRLYREAYRGWNVKHFHEHLRATTGSGGLHVGRAAVRVGSGGSCAAPHSTVASASASRARA